MASKRLERIFKVICVSAMLMILKLLAQWPQLLDRYVLKRRRTQTGFERDLTESGTNKSANKKSNHFHHASYRNKIQTADTVYMKNSTNIVKNIYCSECPFNPHKLTLKHLFHNWMVLDNYYNLSSFLCRGSLIGSLRNADLIPCDRDIDVCVTSGNYHKIRAIRSRKPFNYRSSQIHLAVQDDFYNDDVMNRTRVDCSGREVEHPLDPCSFETPGARLISRGVYVDVFVFRDHGRNLRDHEYEKEVPTTDVFPLKSCKFMGVNAKCPRNETSEG